VSMPRSTRPTPPPPSPPAAPPLPDYSTYDTPDYPEAEEPISEPALNFAGSHYGEERSLSSGSLGLGRHSTEIPASSSPASLYSENSAPYSTSPTADLRGRNPDPPSTPSEYSDAGPYRRQEGSEAEITRPRGAAGRRRPNPRPDSGFPFGPLVVVVGLGVAGLVIWQVLTFLFRPSSTPNEQPQVTVSAPPVNLPSATPTPTATPSPTPSPTPDVPAEWQGISQVRVISNTGLNIRQQPTVQSPIVTGAAGQAVLTVLDVEETTSPTTPIWVQVQVDGTTGWAAAELSGTPLLERLP